jgi:hypothetical protein
MNEKILNKSDILARAKLKWDKKSDINRIRAGSKYKHFFEKHKLPINDWSNAFDGLTVHQQNVIVKGELIRTYDSLENISKTQIMRDFGLSSFSSKWYKLPCDDKKILLNYVIR